MFLIVVHLQYHVVSEALKLKVQELHPAQNAVKMVSGLVCWPAVGFCEQILEAEPNLAAVGGQQEVLLAVTFGPVSPSTTWQEAPAVPHSWRLLPPPRSSAWHLMETWCEWTKDGAFRDTVLHSNATVVLKEPVLQMLNRLTRLVYIQETHKGAAWTLLSVHPTKSSGFSSLKC